MDFQKNNMKPDPLDIPPRMFTSEVLELARFGYGTLRQKQKRGEFPKHVDRGREYIFDGRAVYKALGLVIDENHDVNPWD